VISIHKSHADQHLTFNTTDKLHIYTSNRNTVLTIWFFL